MLHRHENIQYSPICLSQNYSVGSSSATGAGSPIVGEAVRRISHALGAGSDPSVYDRATQKSFVLSVDQAHAVHPNYAGKHEKVSNYLLLLT